jgi:hypothetical protein
MKHEVEQNGSMAESSRVHETGEQRRKWLLTKMRSRRGGYGSDLGALMIARRRSLMFDPSVVGVPYAIVGGVATAAYMPERTTLDIDVLVLSTQLSDVRTNLEANGWGRGKRLTPEPGLGLDGEAWRKGDQFLDVLWSDHEWARIAILEAAQNDRRIIGLPYLVMMKMNAARGVDQGDLTRMLGFAKDELLQQTRRVLKRVRPDLLEDFEQYVAIGKLEVGSDQNLPPPAN